MFETNSLELTFRNVKLWQIWKSCWMNSRNNDRILNFTEITHYNRYLVVVFNASDWHPGGRLGAFYVKWFRRALKEKTVCLRYYFAPQFRMNLPKRRHWKDSLPSTNRQMSGFSTSTGLTCLYFAKDMSWHAQTLLSRYEAVPFTSIRKLAINNFNNLEINITGIHGFS